MNNKTSRIDEVLLKFKKALELEKKGIGFYDLVIKGEYPALILEIVMQRYKDAGWDVLFCKTSSDNGERPGLTRMKIKIP